MGQVLALSNLIAINFCRACRQIRRFPQIDVAILHASVYSWGQVKILRRKRYVKRRFAKRFERIDEE